MVVPPSIEPERLIIRRHVPEDFEPMRSNFCDEEATRLLNMTPEQKTKEGEFVGSCGMAPDDLDPGKIQIFYVIRPEYQGRGYASEAAAGLIECAFSKLGVEMLFASMAAENAASVKVAEKLGMTFEGSAERELNGVVYPGRYSLTKSRFFEVRGSRGRDKKGERADF